MYLHQNHFEMCQDISTTQHAYCVCRIINVYGGSQSSNTHATRILITGDSIHRQYLPFEMLWLIMCPRVSRVRFINIIPMLRRLLLLVWLHIASFNFYLDFISFLSFTLKGTTRCKYIKQNVIRLLSSVTYSLRIVWWAVFHFL